MMPSIFTFNTLIELACFLVAFACLANDRNATWRWMVVFLLVICMAEMTGAYIKGLNRADPTHIRYNTWVYNILAIFQAGFISMMFAKILGRYIRIQPVIKGVICLLSLVYLFELFSHGILIKNNITTNCMSVFFVLYSLYYFYQLQKNEEYIDLKYSADFWWVTGILFFYFGSTAINIFYHKLSGINLSSGRSLTSYIYYALNVLLYGCWSYSFICRKWLTPISGN